MTRRSAAYGRPRQWIVEGEWPTGVFDADAPEAVAFAVHVATVLESALQGVNKSRIAAQAGIERSTLYDVLGGYTWPDMVTLAELELALGVSLWPTEAAPLQRADPPTSSGEA